MSKTRLAADSVALAVAAFLIALMLGACTNQGSIAMEDFNAFSGLFLAVFHIIEPFVALALLALGYWAVAELQRHGYQTTYASAIVRAMGAGVLAAQDKGLDPFSGTGRNLVLQTGAAYLREHVGEAAAKLGIEAMADHAQRVSAQLGVVAAQAEATAQAAAIAAASSMKPEVTSGV